MMMNHQFYKLMLVTNKRNIPEDEYLQLIQVCAISGITAVQLREKSLSYRSLLKLGRALKEILSPLNIPLIVNDHVNLALELDAEGVHLGQADGDAKVARDLLGPDKIIGISIDSMANLQVANELPIDYVGIGAIFPTRNKANVTTIWDIAGLKQASLLSKHPIVAIGGIHENNAAAVMQAGSQGIAAIGAFHDTIDPGVTTKKLRSIVERSN